MTDESVTIGTFEKETKRMVRYATGWGIIYVPKSIFGDGKYPEKVQVTVKPWNQV